MIPSLPLSFDSFIAASALSAWLPRRHMLTLVLLFGLFDAAGSFAAPGWALTLAHVSLVAPGLFLFWGAAVMLGVMSPPLQERSVWWVYALPPLLAIDNLILPGGPAFAAGISSSIAAAIGFCAGSLVLRRLPDPRWGGGAAVAAGLLLAVQA
jgi:hypothetical protein